MPASAEVNPVVANDSPPSNCAGEWSAWYLSGTMPGVDYAVRCRKSDYWSEKNVYVWSMKIRNRLDKDITFDYSFMECQYCNKYQAGRTGVKAGTEKVLPSDYFTETLPCTSLVWVSIDGVEYPELKEIPLQTNKTSNTTPVVKKGEDFWTAPDNLSENNNNGITNNGDTTNSAQQKNTNAIKKDDKDFWSTPDQPVTSNTNDDFWNSKDNPEKVKQTSNPSGNKVLSPIQEMEKYIRQ